MDNVTNQERSIIAEAIRRLAHGFEDEAAYRRTLEFYRASGQEWTKGLG